MTTAKKKATPRKKPAAVKRKTIPKAKQPKERAVPKRQKAGAPTRYMKSFPEKAYKLCRLGAIDTDLADFFNVSVVTLNNWKKAHPEFITSIKKAKEDRNNAVVRSLLERATGYSHTEGKIFCDKGQIVRAETTKHYPPDPTSMIFWLKNRDPKNWRDKQVTEHEFPEGLPSLSDLFGGKDEEGEKK